MNLIPEKAKKAIAAFISLKAELNDDEEADVQDQESMLQVAAPEANAYESQSKGIIDMLQKLLDEFIAERTTAEKEESDSVHAFNLMTQDLNNNIEQATAARTEKQKLKAQKLQAKADAEGSLTDTTTTRDDDQKYLTDLVGTCEQKAADFADRQKLRAEELVAINKAIEIISGEAVSGASEKHLPQLLLQKAEKQTSLAQLRADNASPAQKRVAAYLKEQGKLINSRLLAALAVRVEADSPVWPLPDGPLHGVTRQ